MAVSTDNVFGALVSFVQTSVPVAWLEQVPEQTDDAAVRAMPYVAAEGDLSQTRTFEGLVIDEGQVTLHCYAVGDTAATALGLQVKALFHNPEAWAAIPVTNAQFAEASVAGYGLHEEAELNFDGDPVWRYDVTLNVVLSALR